MAIRRTAMAVTTAALAVVCALSGCGAGSDNATESTGSAPEAPVIAPEGGAGPARDVPDPNDPDRGGDTPGQGTTGAQGAPAKAPDQLALEERSIIYNGTITVRVSNVADASGRAATAATAAGGFVGAENRRSDDRRSETRITLRVPADRFAATVQAIADLGTEESRALSTQDVTEQVADVDSRIANAQASVDRIRALMARAQTIGEITSLESELSRREADLESLKSRKRRLGDLTALSTLTAVLLGPEASVDPAADDTGFVAGLKAGWSAFVTSMEVLLTILGALLPWLLIVGTPVVLLVLWLRRSARSRPPRTGPMVPAMAGPAAPGPVHVGPPVPPPPATAGSTTRGPSTVATPEEVTPDPGPAAPPPPPAAKDPEAPR